MRNGLGLIAPIKKVTLGPDGMVRVLGGLVICKKPLGLFVKTAEIGDRLKAGEESRHYAFRFYA